VTLTLLSTPAAFRYSHKGDYGAGENEGRPVITVEFASRDGRGVLVGAHRTGVLVDSGARTTLLNHDVSQRLGLDLSETRYRKDHVGGITPKAGLYGAWADKGEVLVEICGRWLEIPVFFSLAPDPIRNLLGRNGVFDHVRFAFGHAERAVYCAA
jgi:hypothetical protein